MKQLFLIAIFICPITPKLLFGQASRNSYTSGAGAAPASYSHVTASTVNHINYSHSSNGSHLTGHYETVSKQTVQPLRSPTGRSPLPPGTTTNYRNSIRRRSQNNNVSSAFLAAGSSSSYRLSNNTTIFFTGGAGRYNNAAKKPFAYYTSGITKSKSRFHYFGDVRINHRRRVYWPYTANIPYYDIYYSCEYFYDDLVNETEKANPDNSLEYSSSDGYIVYDEDTISGIVTVDSTMVYLEQSIDENREWAYKASLTDKYLKTIVLFQGSEEMYLMHVPGDTKLMWRLLHNGKLMIYDDNYSFTEPVDIQYDKISVVLPGQTAYLDIENKKQLIWCINKTYGTHLKSKDFTWQALFDYIDTLD